MSYIAEEIVKEQIYQDKGRSFKIFFLILAIVMTAYYVGETLFGKNSLEVYLSLEKKKESLKKNIYNFEHENAALHKEYFELKSLMPKEEIE